MTSTTTNRPRSRSGRVARLALLAALAGALAAVAVSTAAPAGRLSGGAAAFKRNRGGQPIMEYGAIYDRHLSRARRLALSALAWPTNVIGAPLIRRFQI